MIRQQIETGTFAPGDRLPSSRALAVDLGVSRTTVIAALKRLKSAGWIDTRPGAPVRVCHDLPTARGAGSDICETAPRLSDFGINLTVAGAPQQPRSRPEIDFRPGLCPSATFPLAEWRRALSRVQIAADDNPATDQALPQAIQGHLRRVHGVDIPADQIIVLQNPDLARDLCLRLLLNPGDVAVVEDPGRPGLRRLLNAHAAQVRPVPADECGLQTAHLPGGSTRLAIVSTAHHHPFGGTLPADRRQALASWARQNDCYVLDQEGEGLFRFDGPPVPPFDPAPQQGRTLFLGQFGQVMSGLTELCFLIVPLGLIETFAAAQGLLGAHGTMIERHVLADLLVRGAVERHVRRLRRRFAKSRTALMAALARVDAVRVQPAPAGLHAVVWLNRIPASQEQLFCHLARSAGLGLVPLGRYRGDGDDGERPAAILMGFSGLSPEAIELGVLRLEKQLRGFRS